VERLGYATVGDGPQVIFTASASGCSLNSGAGDGGSQVPTHDGKCWLASLPPAGAVDVRIWGADPTGSANSTTAFRNALNNAANSCVYVPPGNYIITDALTEQLGGCLEGDTRDTSVLQINSATFNLSALGVVVLQSTGGHSGTVRDLGFEFTQPQTGVRANLVAFPPAIYAQNASRMVLERLYIGAPNICLDARGNSGGAFVSNIECGALTTGMLWDGSFDTVRVTGWHHWPFGNVLIGATQLQGLFGDGNNVCASIGRIDGLIAHGIGCLDTKFNYTANALMWGIVDVIDGLQMDGGGALFNMVSGNVRITNMYSSPGGTLPAVPGVTISGGRLRLNGYQSYSGATVATIQNTGGVLTISDSLLICSTVSVSCLTTTGGTTIVGNTEFQPQGGPWTAAFLAQSSGGSLAVHNSFFDVAANGAGISFGADIYNNVLDNVNLGGWGVTLPATVTVGQYNFLPLPGKPTVAGGTSPSIDAKANAAHGTVTFGTGTVTSGTITFAAAYSTLNHCRVIPHSTLASFGYSYTLSAITVTATSLTSAVVDYECDGF
jgi:hypothetical protein